MAGLFCFGILAVRAEQTLRIHVTPQFNALPLTSSRASLTNAAGQTFSVTRLDFMVSDFALRQADGTWVEQTNRQAYLSLRDSRLDFEIPGFAPARYDRVRFHVGLLPKLNHSDPAVYPANHPLNPDVNGLHWGWTGGYVFLALEGLWRDSKGEWRGYSYHLANDPQLMTVELPVTLDFPVVKSMGLALNIDRVLPHSFGDENASTHSRAGDPLGVSMSRSVEGAFNVRASASAVRDDETASSNPSPVLIGKNCEPYRFTFSARFPRPDLPLDNPLTQEGVELGRRLFFDKQLSVNDNQSCATCHRPDHAFTDSPKRVSRGALGEEGNRNAMTLLNAAWKSSFFWDGRAPSLRRQVLMPIANATEMHESLDHVVKKLAATDEYPDLFEKAFGSREINTDRLARAIEQFVLTRVACDSKFDRALDGTAQLTDEEKRGFQLFVTEYDPRRKTYGADCFHCHGGSLFRSQSFANNGLDADAADPGLFAVTHNERDRGKFAVPSLRNVELTAPYMHDGRFKTLEEVVAHYCTGVKRSATLDPNLAKHPDGGVPLSAADQKALVAFLKTLTDEQFR